MAIAIVENPEKIRCTLSFTMSLEEWKQICETLKTNPGFEELKIIDEIQGLVTQLDRVFCSGD